MRSIVTKSGRNKIQTRGDWLKLKELLAVERKCFYHISWIGSEERCMRGALHCIVMEVEVRRKSPNKAWSGAAGMKRERKVTK